MHILVLLLAPGVAARVVQLQQKADVHPPLVPLLLRKLPLRQGEALQAPPVTVSRRAAAAALAPLLLPLSSSPAHAFKNALPGVEDEVGRKPAAPAPDGVGKIANNGGLRPCLTGKQNCFSSTTTVGETEVDTTKIGRDWIVQPWTYTGKDVLGALQDLEKAVDAYPPGQNGIDEGGFKVRRVGLPETPEQPAYLYVQFEARMGYIDDMEFVARGGRVQVRTSSRVGQLDYGANAKRYNWFAKKLGSVKGWQTSPIRYKEHLEYAELNDLSSDRDLGL